MIRIYAAFHLNNKIMYDLGIWSYTIALTHFVSELVIFGGCKINVPFMSPMIVAGKYYYSKRINGSLIHSDVSLHDSYISYLDDFPLRQVCY